MTFSFYGFHPPRQWQAGTTGEACTPFFFSCCGCGAKDCEIAGVIATAGIVDRKIELADVAVRKCPDSVFVNPAMFCKPCYGIEILKAAVQEDSIFTGFKPGDVVTFLPVHPKWIRVSGMVQEMINQSATAPGCWAGVNIFSPLPHDPSRVVRVWARDGILQPSKS